MDKKGSEREKIIKQAKEIIKVQGIEQLTVSIIAEQCHISKRTFYELFPSKQALLNQLKQDSGSIYIDDVREIIINKARDLFAEKSYGRIDMDEIAEAAGVKRAALYKYFKSKEELLVCCIEQETETIKEVAGRILANLDNPVQALENYVTGFCNHISDPYTNDLFSEAYNQITYNKKIDECVKDMHHFFVSKFTDVLESGRVKGVFRRDLDSETTAVTILATLNGLELFRKIDPSLDIKQRIKNKVLNNLYYAILSKQS